MKKHILVIALLALVSLMISPVMAETLTGTLGGSNISQTTWNNGQSSPVHSINYSALYIVNIQYVPYTFSVISFDNVGAYLVGVDANAPQYASTNFVGKLNNSAGPIVVTGTIGYARSFLPDNTETLGYQWAVFNHDWNVSGLTGNQYVYLEYDREAVYNMTHACGSGGSMSNGDIAFVTVGSTDAVRGNYLRNIDESTYVSYTFEKPSGLGITGSTNKNVGGILYTNKVYIFNGTSETIITSDAALNQLPLSLNTEKAQIRLGVFTVSGTWYNSSVLFAPAAPTVTPTVTPTPTTTIPAGYVRNNLYVWDQNDAQISGADVDVLDVEAGTWTNTTADADGWITIDTLPYHTVNVYAHYPTSNIYLPNEILGLETGYYGGHNWVIVLYPYTTTPAGFVTLYINTRDYDSKAVLVGVGLQIEDLTTHSVYSYNTGTMDSIWTIVTNATDHRITGSKSGYLSKTIVINSGEASSKTVVVELSKATVTPVPTSTIPPGGVTPVITQDPNDPALHGGDTTMKAQEMMNWLATNGMSLVQLCFLVTILALLGVRLGK